MASLKLAAGSVLDVVSAVAVTVSGSAHLVTGGITLANKAVQYHLDLQTAEQAVCREDFASIAAEKAALARDERMAAIAARNMSPERLAAFNRHYDELLLVAQAALKG